MKKTALFTALSILMTWPLATQIASLAPQHHDVYFNMWRLLWFAHALSTSPARILDANIFHPEPRTLTYSDAMFAEGLLAAPLVWAGVKPVLLHNLMLLAAMTSSGVAMFALAQYLTGSRGAGVLAGIVFSYAPYRFEHFAHMELQWAVWTPLAFLALHRACDTGRVRWGLAVGACLALQMLSSIYYGIFLATMVAFATPLLLPRDRTAPLRDVIKALTAGAVLAAVVCGLYAIPYLETHKRLGDRPTEEINTYSASPSNYLAATPDSWLYRGTAARGRPERRLFPGLTPLLLALVGLLLRVPGRRPIVYLLLLVFAFEASLGVRGFVYPFLHDYVPGYRGLRASARLGLFVLAFLGVLAGYGYQALASGRSRWQRVVLVSLAAVATLAEYRVQPQLAPFPSTPPDVYRMLSRQPPGVVAEFPTTTADRLPGPDPEYAYYSVFHWRPLVNGYSGMYPSSYIQRLDRLSDFPSERALRQLRGDRVSYVILHGGQYSDIEREALRLRLSQSGDFVELAAFTRGASHDWLYRLR